MRRPFVEAVGRVAVEDRPAERHVLGRVAVAANRHVPAGHHELELVAPRLAENRDAVLRRRSRRQSSSSCLIDPLVPVGVDDAFEDAADDRLLILGVEIAVDELLGDVPVVGHARPQQAALRILVVPRKANRLALLGRKRFEQHLHQRLGRPVTAATGGAISAASPAAVETTFGAAQTRPSGNPTADRSGPNNRAAGRRQKIAPRHLGHVVNVLAAITRQCANRFGYDCFVRFCDSMTRPFFPADRVTRPTASQLERNRASQMQSYFGSPHATERFRWHVAQKNVARWACTIRTIR